MQTTPPPLPLAWRERFQAETRKKALPPHWGPSDPSPLSPTVSNEVGWRFAGLIDGEGCFHIAGSHKPGSAACRCVLSIAMRADDRAFLSLMRDAVGLGRLYDVRRPPSSSRPGSKPLVRWEIVRRAECVALVNLLDRFPPLSKKGADYALWREAVIEWTWGKWDRMRVLRSELMASRAYVETAVPA